MTEKEVLQRCQSGDERAYAWIYETYWPEFSRWIQKQGCPAHQASDVYNQTVLAFYRNVESGRLQELWSGLKTYLFQIGKNQWNATLRGEIRKKNRLEEFLTALPVSENPFERDHHEAILQRVEREIKRLGEPCASLLSLSFQQEMSDREIADQTSYKNTDSVKTARWKCLEKLRHLFFSENKPT